MVQKELNQYTQRGWSVFPLHGKKPACAKGFKDGTVEMAKIQGWLGNGHRNFGIVTGKASGIVVLDIDPRNGGDKSLQTLVETIGTLPKTPRVQTGGGGWHYYFKYPESVEIRCRNNLYAGIDLKADGGYVVAPPSIHPETGQAYQ